jgi:hypothetical protein
MTEKQMQKAAGNSAANGSISGKPTVIRRRIESAAIIDSIQEIYDRFNIMHNLRLHMARVAGAANMICDNWNGSISRRKYGIGSRSTRTT